MVTMAAYLESMIAFRWLLRAFGFLAFFLVLAAMAAFMFLVATSFAADLVTALGTVAGVVGGLSALTFSYAQSLENEAQRRHVNREAKHLFVGTIMLFLAAFFRFVFGTTGNSVPALTGVFNIISLVCVGLFMLLGFFFTSASLSFVLNHLTQTPEDLETREQARAARLSSGRRRVWLDRVLER
jgi:hypothetical protein